jgi:hypothetical protein
MGKMKELFMEIREKEAQQEEIKRASTFDSGINCPNCLKSHLIEYSHEDLYCESCSINVINFKVSKK